MHDAQRPLKVSKRHAQSVKAVNGYHLRCSATPRCTHDLAGTICENASFTGLWTPGTGFCHQTDCRFVMYVKTRSRWTHPLGDKKTSPREIWGRETLQCTYACTSAQPIQPMQTLVQVPYAPCRPCMTLRDLHKSVNDTPKASKLSKVTIWGVHQPQDAHRTLLVSTVESATFMGLSTPGTESCHRTDCRFKIYAKNWSR
jgi:hypothetical protein